MSRLHGYLTFVGGQQLDQSLTSAFENSDTWRKDLTARNTSLYAVPAPEHVASAFVLQYLLSIPAQISAFAAVTGPWVAELGTLDNSRISCDIAPGLYPERLGFLSVAAAPTDLDERLEGARAAYRVLGQELAQGYDGGVKMSSLQRLGMVEDLWEMAEREARGATGGGVGPAVERLSCCFIFALPGCHECAGCPRLSTAPD